MRENRLYGSEGGEPQLNAAFLPLSLRTVFTLLVVGPELSLRVGFADRSVRVA